MNEPKLLNSTDMALFASRGFLRMDEIVPPELNQQFLDEIGHVDESEISDPMSHYGKVMQSSAIPVVNAGVPFKGAYPEGSALQKIVTLPEIAGAIKSLVGTNPIFDHHFLHITFPPSFYKNTDRPQVSQHTHQDSTIDPRKAFDVQLM
ncbi:MAG: hypothetical protein AAF512_16165, partial [Pseudomonadota bacterium]